MLMVTERTVGFGDLREYAEKLYMNIKAKFLLPDNLVFQPIYWSYRPITVRSTYVFTATIMFLTNCEFGDYPPTASAYVKKSGTLDNSKNYPRREPQTIRLITSTLVNVITTIGNEIYICTALSVYVFLLLRDLIVLMHSSKCVYAFTLRRLKFFMHRSKRVRAFVLKRIKCFLCTQNFIVKNTHAAKTILLRENVL